MFRWCPSDTLHQLHTQSHSVNCSQLNNNLFITVKLLSTETELLLSNLWLESSGVFRGRGHSVMSPLCHTPQFFLQISTGTDVWCEAICCRHIYVKTVFQSASEHVIFIQKIEKFSGDPTSTRRGDSLPHPLPSALNRWPPYQNPK